MEEYGERIEPAFTKGDLLRTLKSEY